MESEINNIIKVYLSTIASLSYCYFISSKIPKGKFRLLSLLPIMALFFIFPFSFSYLCSSGVASVFLSWFANFKLLLFAFDCNPLSSAHSLFKFICIALLPVKINQKKNHPSPPNPKFSKISYLLWPAKFLVFAVLVNVNDYKEHLNHKIVLAMYCCLVYLFVDIVLGVCSTLVFAVLNLELEAPSRDPYFSTSLQDFWGGRWNLIVSNLLRYTIYKPVRSSHLGIALASCLGEWAPMPGLFASFLVSGLMHELLFYHITRVGPTWEVTCFFLLHGVCLILELGLKTFIKGRWGLHWTISGPLTVGFVVVTAMWLFFPPIDRTGAAETAIQECKAILNFVKEIMKNG